MNQKMTYETMDWDAEAKRIAVAFGIKGECEWCDASEEGEGKLLCLKDTGISSIQLTPSTFLWVQHCEYCATFSITDRSANGLESWNCIPSTSTNKNPYPQNNCIQLLWAWDDGPACIYSTKDYLQPLRKGLFHMDLLTAEVEAELGVQLTAHEKIEWSLELSERLRA